MNSIFCGSVAKNFDTPKRAKSSSSVPTVYFRRQCFS
ncbi:unnamed protein product [Tenebrio molitor]|nr:unnamed protein product [Tenebrio molitor]